MKFETGAFTRPPSGRKIKRLRVTDKNYRSDAIFFGAITN